MMLSAAVKPFDPAAEPEPRSNRSCRPTRQKANQQQGHTGTAALVAVAEQLADPPSGRAAPCREGRRGAAAAASPQPPLPPPASKQDAAGAGAVAASTELVPLSAEQLQRRSKQQANSAASRQGGLPARPSRISGQGAFKPPRLAEAAIRRDKLAAEAKAAEAEYAKLAAEEAAAAAEAAGAVDGASGQSGEEDIQDWPEAESQQLVPTQRGPSIRQLAAAPERTLAISTATPAGYRPSVSPAVPLAATAERCAVACNAVLSRRYLCCTPAVNSSNPPSRGRWWYEAHADHQCIITGVPDIRHDRVQDRGATHCASANTRGADTDDRGHSCAADAGCA